ncbi:hypothetical protein SNE40_015750 [Patella caerulea]
MPEKDYQILQSNREVLVSELIPNSLTDYLFSKFIFDECDLEEIQAEQNNKGRSAAAKKFLEVLAHSGENAYPVFLEALKKYGFNGVVKTLEETVVDLPSDSFAWIDNIEDNKKKQPLKERDLNSIAGFIGANWGAIILELQGTEASISQAQLNHAYSLHMQIFSCLNKWRQREASKATLIKLLTAMRVCNNFTKIDWDHVRKFVERF